MSNPKFHQCEGADGEFLGKLNSMGSWCANLSNYMGGWCLRKLNSMGGWIKKSAISPPPRFFSGIALRLLHAKFHTFFNIVTLHSQNPQK